MSGPSDRRFDLNLGEEAVPPSPDNIWRPSFISPTGPLTVRDSVMKNDMTAAVVARNLVTPKDNRLLAKRSDELAVKCIQKDAFSGLLEQNGAWNECHIFGAKHLPSSSGAAPRTETPNDQPPMPSPSGAPPTAEALLTTETSPKQPL
ncbi:unnamed protein product [Malus baccata var. baccata]